MSNESICPKCHKALCKCEADPQVGGLDLSKNQTERLNPEVVEALKERCNREAEKIWQDVVNLKLGANGQSAQDYRIADYQDAMTMAVTIVNAGWTCARCKTESERAVALQVETSLVRLNFCAECVAAVMLKP